MLYDNKKIYDVISINDEYFFLDNQFKLILNNQKENVGIYKDKNNLYFYKTIDRIINEIKNTNKFKFK
jgi:hypothetical protein